MRASIGLFCSASDDLPESARTLAAEFGQLAAQRHIRLVYGGSARGLMGIAARAAHAAGGEVLGFMLDALRVREHADGAVGTQHFVATLKERKESFASHADAFVALPGGLGTLDELGEMLVLNDIGVHSKPVILCDNDGFWDSYVAMLGRFAAYGVLRPGLERHLLRASGAQDALDRFAGVVAPEPAAACAYGPVGVLR
jgi:uncharacterized protein (TIGR00730 family)